ncbi:MAG: thymidine kinase [Myxococcales bacterium]|nr:MAG: thymidine kinase [Myxococcales bacterium]
MRYFTTTAGWIEVIVGSMFSGKTTELLRRLDRMRRAGRKVQVFSRDRRFAENAVVSHDRLHTPSTWAETSAEIEAQLKPDTDIVGVDEGQFYDEGLVDVCRRLAARGRVVIVAGLDQDWRTEPFMVMARLMAEAEFVTKLNAVCSRCGNPAIRNWRKAAGGERILLGAEESYQALCRGCYEVAVLESRQIEMFPAAPPKSDEKP